MKFLHTIIFSLILIPLLTAQTVTFDSFDGNAGFLSFAPAAGVVGQEDYVMDISGTGNPTGTLTELRDFTFVGGVDVINGEVQFDFFDSSGNFVNGFVVALPQAGSFIWGLTAPPGFIIPTSGIVQMTVDPNMNGGVLGQWLLVDEALTTGSIGSSPGNPFGLGPTPDGNSAVFAFQLIILGDPISDDCPSLLIVDGDVLMNNEIASDTYAAQDTILSIGTVPSPNVVTFEAGEVIILQQGFEAENGSTFTARIQTCTSSIVGGQSEGIFVIENKGKVNANAFGIENRSNPLVIENEVNVYPNPFSEQTTIEIQLATESDLQVELYSLTGSRISTIASDRNAPAGIHQFPVNASNLEVGMYLLVIRTNDKIQTQKLSLIK